MGDAARCRECGAARAPGAEWCGQCLQRFDGAPPPPPQAPPARASRWVTALKLILGFAIGCVLYLPLLLGYLYLFSLLAGGGVIELEPREHPFENNLARLPDFVFPLAVLLAITTSAFLVYLLWRVTRPRPAQEG